MSNTKNQFKKIILGIKNVKLWKKVILFEILIFCIAVIVLHSHGACSRFAVGGLGGCMEYISFFKYFGFNYFYFVLQFTIIISIFLILTIALGKLTEKILAKLGSYQKIFVIELWCFLSVIFILAMFLVAIYNGSSCLLDNCVNVLLVRYIYWWETLLITGLFSNPIIIGVIAVPYLVVFIYKFFKRTKNKSVQ